MKFDYIMTYDINSFLPYREFFGTSLSIFENKKIVDYFKNIIWNKRRRNIETDKYCIRLAKLEKNDRKYVKYTEKTMYGYYIVQFAERNWILDEKNNILIDLSLELFDNLDINNKFIINELEKFNQYNKPVSIEQSYTPLFEFDTKDLTFMDKLNILHKLEIKTIIDCEEKNQRFLNGNTVYINSNDDLKEFLENPERFFKHFLLLFEAEKSEVKTILETPTRDLTITYEHMNNIIKHYLSLVADISKIPEEYLYDYAILKFKPQLDEDRIKCITKYGMTDEMQEITYDVDSIVVEENHKYIHPALVAFCYMPDVFSMGLTRDKLILASKVLYSTKNPKALEPILGEELCNLFNELAISTIPTNGYDINKMHLENVTPRDLEDIVKNDIISIKKIISLSRCSKEEEYEIRSLIIQKFPSYLELFDILRMIEMNRTITEEASITKTLKKD